MRAAPLALVLVLAPALLPQATADQYQDATIGVNLGVVAPGIWDMFYLHSAGGILDARLTWLEPEHFPFADYDLRLYQPWAFDDQNFDDSELVAQSSQHPYAHHSERIVSPIGTARYLLVVAPFQAQLEKYTLDTSMGSLEYAGTAFGYIPGDA